MVVTLAGNNAYAIKARLDELTASFVEKYGELALERIDAEDAEEQAIISAAKSLPFLSQRKMIVVRNLSNNKSASEQIEQILSSIPESTDIVLYEPLTDRRTSFYKTLKRKTELEEHHELDSRSLPKWLAERAKILGGSLSLADAGYLVSRVGTNQQILSSELEKLVIFNPSISRDSIDELTEQTPQSKIFDLLDAAFGTDKKRALKLYDDQRKQKIEPKIILAMAAWQLQLIALVKFAGGRSASQIAKDSEAREYPVTKAMSLASKITESKLKELVEELLRIDYKTKTSPMSLDEALKTYITLI